MAKTKIQPSFLIGIDAGFRGMGYAVFSPHTKKFLEVGSFRTQKAAKKLKLRVSSDDVDSCQFLVRSLNGLFDKCPPIAVFVELPNAGAKGARANRTMGLATAIIVSILESRKIPASYLIPSDVRKVLCGKRNAGKEAAAQVVLDAHPDVSWPTVDADREHALDAGAVLMASENDPLYLMGARRA